MLHHELKPSILLLRTIFAPNELHIKSNIDSFRSSLNTIRTILIHNQNIDINFDINFDIKMLGWVALNVRHLFIEQLNDVMNEYNDIVNMSDKRCKIEYDFFDNNYGKLHAIKTMIKNISMNSYVMFIYADHDIQFDESTTEFIKLLFCENITIKYKSQQFNESKMSHQNLPIKFVSFRQRYDERHDPIIYTNNINININTNDNIRCHYSLNNIHIASGCFVTDFDGITIISQLTSYSEYGDEDVLIGERLNELSLLHVVLVDYYVIHPYDIDITYSNWKKQKIFIGQAVRLLNNFNVHN